MNFAKKLFSINMKYKDEEQKVLVKKMQKLAWELSKKAIVRKLKKSDVDKYEKLCIEYNKKYPTEDFSGTQERINKLRLLAN